MFTRQRVLSFIETEGEKVGWGGVFVWFWLGAQWLGRAEITSRAFRVSVAGGCFVAPSSNLFSGRKQGNCKKTQGQLRTDTAGKLMCFAGGFGLVGGFGGWMKVGAARQGSLSILVEAPPPPFCIRPGMDGFDSIAVAVYVHGEEERVVQSSNVSI